LKEILAGLPPSAHPDLLVGLDTSDDAGVVRLSPELALIQTVDFFTPIVDDPYHFGAIAAANALSDVYAMGGIPLTALNIVCFPIKDLSPAVLGEILRGGADKLREADVHLAGGHSVDDPEPKYGLSVTGTVHPDHVATNAGARPGDQIVLTKALGVGILTTAAKSDALDANTLAAALASMSGLNRAAADAMRAVGIGSGGVHAATDITGFGLLGHLSHVVRASRISIRLRSDDVPLLPRTLDLARAGFTTGGGAANAEYLADIVQYADAVSDELRAALVDPQTSGGLAIFVAESRRADLLRELAARGVGIQAVIGSAEPIAASGRPTIFVE
jgi:selenide,water dikinase